MTYEVIIAVSTGLSTACAVLATVYAWILHRRARDLAAYMQWPEARLQAAEHLLSDLDQRQDQNYRHIRKIQARLAASAKRRLQENGGDGGDQDELPLATRQGHPLSRRADESESDWKARVRAAIHLKGVPGG